MIGVLSKVTGLFDLWSGHRRLIEDIKKIEADRKVHDIQIDDLTKATMDDDEGWFLEFVKRDPSCALKVIEECNKKNA